MPRVHLSRRAQRDFDEIIDYLAAVASDAVADKYGRNIQAAINRLAEMPELAARRDEFRGDTRVAIVHPYLIFYEISADKTSVEVLRILHGRRNVTDRLLRPGRVRD